MGPALVVLIGGGSALAGGCLGALAPGAWRRLAERPDRPTKSRWTPTKLDPDQAARVRSVSQAWAKRQGRPEAAPWAEGYLEDAALFVQRHQDREGQR